MVHHPSRTNRPLSRGVPPRKNWIPSRRTRLSSLPGLGDGAPTWKEGQSRRIDLNTWRIPDLVGEVSDTTLAVDLDEMKQLYAALGIPEYWVINVKGRQVLAFGLQENGKYQPIETSLNLPGLPIALLEQTLDRLTEESNISAAQWFMKTLV